jgi:transcriptional regulator with XRE-family HTH domain
MSKPISETIREAMIATGLNDLEISRQVGVSQPQLWHFRRGSNPKASTIDKLADWLGFTLTRSERKQFAKQKSARQSQPAGRPKRKHPHADKERENESKRL